MSINLGYYCTDLRMDRKHSQEAYVDLALPDTPEDTAIHDFFVFECDDQNSKEGKHGHCWRYSSAVQKSRKDLVT